MSLLKDKGGFFNDKEGASIYTFQYKGKEFNGYSMCHKDDFDMKSEFVGLALAELRAYNEYLKYRRSETIIKRQTLKSIYADISKTHDFDGTSKYAKTIAHAIAQACEDIALIEEGIELNRLTINSKIEAREKLYQKIRANRKKDESAV